ncbi:MAG: TonB-dependent receptor [Muribaculaceae bacterium]|nr:TonB-dependent receptor [Muribaculaceae bacterium]
MKTIRTIVYAVLLCTGSSAAMSPAQPGEREPGQAAADSLVDGHLLLRQVEVEGVKQTVRSDAMAATDISQAMVNRLGITAAKDVGTIAPNFYMPDYGSRMTSSIYVRGLGSRMDQPVVGLQVDGVPYLNKDAFDFDIFDIASIEVLRGARATLNGRNSMGGRIIVNTLSPWQTEGFRALAEYGRLNSIRGGLGWYGKLSESLATSVTAQYSSENGARRNVFLDRRTGDSRQADGRWKLSWRPNTWLSLTNTASLSDSYQDGYPYRHLTMPDIAYADTCSYRRTLFSDGLTAVFAGKRMVVTSTTSFQYMSDDMRLDQDFLPDDYFTLRQKRHETTFSEDMFAKGSRGDYDWLGGVFVFSRSTDMHAPVTFKDTGISKLIEAHRNDVNPEYPIEWFSRRFTLGSDFTMGNTGFALYHQSTYTLGDWTFDAGLRWDIERASLSYHSYCNTGYRTWHILPDGQRELYSTTPVDINDSDRLGRTFNELLPKLTVTWRRPWGSVYADITKAYKAGGYNTQMFSDVLQQRIMGIMGIGMQYTLDDIVGYLPEKSWNYEAGIKASLFSGRLDLSATAFVIDCRDQQLTVFPSGTTTGRIMTNAGRTLSRGLELTAGYRPVEQVQLQAAWGYTKATFRRFFDGINDYRGRRVPYAPENTLFVNALWIPDFDIAGIRPQLDMNLRCAGDIYFNEANSVRQPFYAVLGSSLTFNAAHWSLRLWGENISNTRYMTFYFVSIGNAFVQESRPWSIGATLKVRF